MKSRILRFCLVLVYTFFAIDANAQRPVWVVGHACNSHQCLIDALADGGCGVEIDLHTDEANKNKDWSVNHGLKFPYVETYLSEAERKSRNNKQGRIGTTTEYVSLEQYLRFPEMNKLSILWLDVKTGEYLVELVKHVHAVLKEVYPDGNIPYSIIYGVYTIDVLNAPIPGTSDLVIDWLRDNLWEKEGINLAYEGKDKNQKNGLGSGFFEEIEDLMTSHRFPISKHFMTCGFGASYFVFSWSVEPKNIIAAKNLRSQGRYCSKIGFWTCASYSDAIWFIEPKWKGIQTECDLVLVECRNEFAAPGHKTALSKLVEYFFNSNGCYYNKYNGGRTRIADQTDVFYRMP